METKKNLDELEREGYFQLVVSGDRMKAELLVKRPLSTEELQGYENLSQFLRRKGIVYGLQDVIERDEGILQRTGTYLLAEGTRPQKGKDGEVRLLFAEEIQRELRENEEGRVDFYSFLRVPQVTPGDLLAELVPPEEGVPGKDIFGKEIPASLGKPAKIVVGKNVELSEDGKGARAKIAGRPVVVGKAISVLPLFEVEGNVGVHTGNLSFVGSILVRGNVESDFAVEAEGDVEVWGNVEAAKVVAGGNVRVRGGIFGANRGSVRAGGSLQAKVVENASIEVGGEVIVERAILHSQIAAKENVILRGNPGAIIGGVIKAGNLVWARTIGSSIGTRTEIIVGVDPVLHEEHKCLQETIQKLQSEIQDAEKIFQLLAIKQQAGKGFDFRAKEILLKAKKAYDLAHEKKGFCETRLAELEELLGSREGKVLVEEKVYPQVRITIGRFTYVVRDEIQYVSFREENKEVVLGTFERPKLAKR